MTVIEAARQISSASRKTNSTEFGSDARAAVGLNDGMAAGNEAEKRSNVGYPAAPRLGRDRRRLKRGKSRVS